MELLEYRDEPRLSTAELIASVESLVGVRKFEYEPRISFMHATVDREHIHPYDLIRRIEEGGISADGLFVFYPQSFGADYTQHFQYNAKLKAFENSNGVKVDTAKILMAA